MKSLFTDEELQMLIEKYASTLCPEDQICFSNIDNFNRAINAAIEMKTNKIGYVCDEHKQTLKKYGSTLIVPNKENIRPIPVYIMIMKLGLNDDSTPTL